MVGDEVYIVVSRELKPARVTHVSVGFFVCEQTGSIVGTTTRFCADRDQGHLWCRADDQVMADAMRVTWGWRT